MIYGNHGTVQAERQINMRHCVLLAGWGLRSGRSLINVSEKRTDARQSEKTVATRVICSGFGRSEGQWLQGIATAEVGVFRGGADNHN